MDSPLHDDTAEPQADDVASRATDPAATGGPEDPSFDADAPGTEELEDDEGVEKDPELIAFGANIRELRLKAKMTQEVLAKRSGLHWTYISQVERGVRNTSYTSLRKLAQGLGVAPGRVMPDKP